MIKNVECWWSIEANSRRISLSGAPYVLQMWKEDLENIIPELLCVHCLPMLQFITEHIINFFTVKSGMEWGRAQLIDEGHEEGFDSGFALIKR